MIGKVRFVVDRIFYECFECFYECYSLPATSTSTLKVLWRQASSHLVKKIVVVRVLPVHFPPLDRPTRHPRITSPPMVGAGTIVVVEFHTHCSFISSTKLLAI